jgi:hypothetical protein
MSGIIKRNGIRTPPLAGFAFSGRRFWFPPGQYLRDQGSEGNFLRHTPKRRAVAFADVRALHNQIEGVLFAFVRALQKKEHPVLRIGRNLLGQFDDEEVVVLAKEALSIADVAEYVRQQLREPIPFVIEYARLTMRTVLRVWRLIYHARPRERVRCKAHLNTVVTVRFMRVFATSILTSVLTYPFPCSTGIGFQAAESWTAMRLIATNSRAHSARC